MRGNGADPESPHHLDGTVSGPAQNGKQSVFREVNERIGRFAIGSDAGGQDSYICECGDPRCTEPMKLTRAEYEAVRRHANRFAILPNHEDPATDTLVEQYGRYSVVEAAARPGEAP